MVKDFIVGGPSKVMSDRRPEVSQVINLSSRSLGKLQGEESRL